MRVVLGRFLKYWRSTLASLLQEPYPVETAIRSSGQQEARRPDLGRVMKELDETLDRSRETQ